MKTNSVRQSSIVLGNAHSHLQSQNGGCKYSNSNAYLVSKFTIEFWSEHIDLPDSRFKARNVALCRTQSGLSVTAWYGPV